jgi:hypothetical protein
MVLGSGIRDPGSGQKGTGSRIRIRNTGSLEGHPVSTDLAGASQRRVNVNQAAGILYISFLLLQCKKIAFQHVENVR